MKNNQLDPQKALNPAYKKFNPSPTAIDNFSKKLEECINTINLIDSKNESEEHLKSPIIKFLTSTFYAENEINTKERIDLAIYLGKDASSNVGVILEAKKPSNKSEFPKINQLNCKAFQEILLYYLRERIDYKNNNIKHLVITNGFEWFFFKAEDFYDIFYKNKKLISEYEKFRDGLKDTSRNELFYNEIAKNYIAEVENEIPFVYVDFRKKSIQNFDKRELVNIYKLFSDVHLLGKSFGNDSNQLNKAFYNELLHIIGLEEVKESGKKLIQRKKDKDRDYASLLENTIFTLEDKEHLYKVKNIPNDENKSFNVGLELCLTWVNRILFLKLLESQLLSYNNKNSDFKFLNFAFLNGYDSLNDLFFSALAKPIKERHEKYGEKFKNIPYLNSSLFEHSDLEGITFDITALKDEEMEVYSATILKDSNGRKLGGKLNTLDYLFRFLDAYDFSTESGIDSGDQHENKTLINASVLGLIFEKINGYKDGSFYTPGLITMFMCKETLRKTVTQKFQEQVNESIQTFDDVKDYCGKFFRKEDIKKFNEIINAIRICDPAVGSGHFLVSALNEIIAIKSELQILADENGTVLPCEIQIENDELYISDADGTLFEYQRKDPNSLKIQKAIFHEKETLIENCLFGVDINPNSVNICRLRLWIELLKNAYYTSEGELQTLPNIDINIKCGNALISRFKLDDSLKTAFKNKEVTYSIEEYKTAVKDYKTTNSKTKKKEVEEIISSIKNNFKSTLDNKIKDKVSKAVGDYQTEEQRQQNLIIFGESIKKSEKDLLKKLQKKAEEAQKEKEEILNNMIYRNAFEWRFEFPEALDDEGNFIGFDVIVGNPPYIRIQGIREMNSILADEYVKRYDSATGSFDIYSLFVEKGLEILKKNGIVNYIMPVKWTNSAFGSGLRQIISKSKAIYKIINFGSYQAFDASTYTGLQWFQKNSDNLLYFEIDKDFKTNVELGEYLNSLTNADGTIVNFDRLTKDNWTLTVGKIAAIIDKLNQQSRRMSDVFDKIFQGLATSKDDVYFLYDCTFEENYVIGFSKQLAKLVKIENSFTKPLLKGEDVHRYECIQTDRVVVFPYKLINEKAELYTEEEIKNNFPLAYLYLKECENILRDREKGKFNIDGEWFQFGRKQGINFAEREKLVAPEISLGGNFSYDKKGQFYSTTTVYGYIKKNEAVESYKALMALLNSQLFWWYLVNTGTVLANNYFRFKSNYILPFPVPEIPKKIDNSLQKLVNKIHVIKQNTPNENTDELELEINKIIFDLYELTTEEINLINEKN